MATALAVCKIINWKKRIKLIHAGKCKIIKLLTFNAECLHVAIEKKSIASENDYKNALLHTCNAYDNAYTDLGSLIRIEQY